MGLSFGFDIGSALGSLLGAGSSLIANNQNIKAQNAINDKNIAYQKEFAQNGIQWRVADAKNAGVHPLAALGAQTTGFSPVLQSARPGDGISQAGGYLANMFKSMQIKSDKNTLQKQELELENMRLQNEQLKKDLAGQNPLLDPNKAVDNLSISMKNDNSYVKFLDNAFPGFSIQVLPPMNSTEKIRFSILPSQDNQTMQELIGESKLAWFLGYNLPHSNFSSRMTRYLKDLNIPVPKGYSWHTDWDPSFGPTGGFVVTLRPYTKFEKFINQSTSVYKGAWDRAISRSKNFRSTNFGYEYLQK